MEQSQKNDTSLSDELLLWYNATIIRLMDDKNNLEAKLKTHQAKLNIQVLSQLQSELQSQFSSFEKTISKVKSIWIQKGEDEFCDKQSKLFSEMVDLKQGGVKEVLIKGRQIYPIPSYLDITDLSFIKIETLSNKILDTLAKCQQLENIAVGGGDKPSNIDDVMASHLIQKLPKIKIISLWDTTITDNGVKQFKQLQNLSSLVVQSLNFTSEGKKEAQEYYKGINTIFSIKK